MPETQVRGYDIEPNSLSQQVSYNVDLFQIDTDRVNIISVDPSDTATFFGTNDSGESILHIRIGNGSGDKVRVESWNGSASTSLMEIGQNTVTILGDLVVSGTTTTINSQTVDVEDNYITLNSGVTGAPSLDAGIIVNRGTSQDVMLVWNETDDEWQITDDSTGSNKFPIFIGYNNKTNSRFYFSSQDPTGDTRLNYDGYFYATRVYNAVYNDLAEFMPAEDTNCYAGDVLFWNKKGVRKTTKRAQQDVVGVYSDTFGFALGADNKEGKIPIAITGRVQVFVQGKIKKGQELVSYKDGKAVKANIFERIFKRNAIIGKALETTKSSSKIWILVK